MKNFHIHDGVSLILSCNDKYLKPNFRFMVPYIVNDNLNKNAN
jgi:hypothetical protein